MAIDIQAAQVPAERTGAVGYIESVLPSLLRSGSPDQEVIVIVSPFAPVPAVIADAVGRAGASVSWMPLALPSAGTAGDDRVVADAYDALPISEASYLALGPLETLGHVDVCSPASAPVWATWVEVLIHDLTPALLPEYHLEPLSGFELRYRDRLRFCAEADVVHTATGYLAEQAAYCLGRTSAHIQAAGLAPPLATGWFGAGPPGPPGRPGKSLVYAYDPAPQRRPELLIRAAGRLPVALRQGLELVFATRPEEEAGLRRLAVECGLAPAGVEVVPAEAGNLDRILSGAAAYVVPSCSEGYDLSALEVPRRGVPAIVSEGVGGLDGAGFDQGRFDPGDADALVEMLQRVLVDGQWRDALVAAQAAAVEALSWADVAARLLGTGSADSGQPVQPRQGSAARCRPAVAITGPLPPVQSGISQYIEDQTRATMSRIRVSWVDPASPAEVPPEALWWHHLANHRLLHIDQFRLISEQRGVVEIHDAAMPFVISSLLVPPPGVEAPPELQGELESVFRERGASYLDAEEAGIGVILSWLARHADSLAVHSGQARDMVRAHVAEAEAPVFVVPLGSWMSEESRRMALSRQIPLPDRPFVVAPGFVGPAKWPEGIIEAVGRIPAERRPLLVFAGRCPPHLVAKLGQQAARRHVDILITGFLANDDFDTWLARASAAVIGRLVIRGETSATVLRASRMGTPTVVAASGAFSERPDGVTLIRSVPAAPSALAEELSRVLASPLASPLSSERNEMFSASLGPLREAFSWEPTIELMSALAQQIGS